MQVYQIRKQVEHFSEKEQLNKIKKKERQSPITINRGLSITLAKEDECLKRTKLEIHSYEAKSYNDYKRRQKYYSSCTVFWLNQDIPHIQNQTTCCLHTRKHSYLAKTSLSLKKRKIPDFSSN